MHQVDSIPSALEAIETITAIKRMGGTNIQAALLSSLTQIRETQTHNELVSAQIVLITDGDAPVSLESIESKRATLGSLPLGVSVIALGEENTTLRQMVATSRMRGESTFYHFVSDQMLERLEATSVAVDPEPSIPAIPRSDLSPDDLRQNLASLLEELTDLQAVREQAARRALERARSQRALDLDASESIQDEGARAAIEARYQDTAQLQQRFERWFPSISEAAVASPLPERGTIERDDLDGIIATLSTIAEVVEYIDGGPAQRQADAIELLERLLPDTRLSPSRYLQTLDQYPHALAPAMAHLKASVLHGLRRRLVAR